MISKAPSCARRSTMRRVPTPHRGCRSTRSSASSAGRGRFRSREIRSIRSCVRSTILRETGRGTGRLVVQPGRRMTRRSRRRHSMATAGHVVRVGRIPYVNCYPVYGAIDRGIVPLEATVVDGVPTALNRMMAAGNLDVSVVSAVEYARDAERYLLLPDLAISCDGPVQSVMLFAKRPAEDLGGRRVLVSRSSMTSAALL